MVAIDDIYVSDMHRVLVRFRFSVNRCTLCSLSPGCAAAAQCKASHKYTPIALDRFETFDEIILRDLDVFVCECFSHPTTVSVRFSWLATRRLRWSRVLSAFCRLRTFAPPAHHSPTRTIPSDLQCARRYPGTVRRRQIICNVRLCVRAFVNV